MCECANTGKTNCAWENMFLLNAFSIDEIIEILTIVVLLSCYYSEEYLNICISIHTESADTKHNFSL